MTERSPDERRDAVLRHLGSYEQLHLLVVMAGDPGRRWMTEELSARGLAEVDGAADELVQAGLLTRWPDQRLSLSADPEVSAGAAILLREYQDNPLPIVQQLTERSMARLRSVTARSFADAFVVRRKDS